MRQSPSIKKPTPASHPSRSGRSWLVASHVLMLLWASHVSAQTASGNESEVAAAHLLLAEMNDAFANRTYDGIFSYYTGEDLATLRVVHMVVGGEQRERLEHLNGAPREIVRKGEEVACILLPGDKLLELEGSIPSGPFARAFVRRFDQLSNLYGLSMYGEDRVAGRRAIRMSVTPKDSDRFGYRIWLDKETKLLLRSELLDENGKRLEIFQFTQIKYDAEVMPSALEPTNSVGSLVSHLTLAKNNLPAPHSTPVSWHAGWLPQGFEMSAMDLRHAPGTKKPVNTLMYSDGLAAFSVFIEQMPHDGAASMVSRTGATVALTHVTKGPDSSPFLITVVGELPVDTAKKIAQAVSFSQSS